MGTQFSLIWQLHSLHHFFILLESLIVNRVWLAMLLEKLGGDPSEELLLPSLHWGLTLCSHPETQCKHFLCSSAWRWGHTHFLDIPLHCMRFWAYQTASHACRWLSCFKAVYCLWMVSWCWLRKIFTSKLPDLIMKFCQVRHGYNYVGMLLRKMSCATLMTISLQLGLIDVITV